MHACIAFAYVQSSMQTCAYEHSGSDKHIHSINAVQNCLSYLRPQTSNQTAIGLRVLFALSAFFFFFPFQFEVCFRFLFIVSLFAYLLIELFCQTMTTGLQTASCSFPV